MTSSTKGAEPVVSPLLGKQKHGVSQTAPKMGYADLKEFTNENLPLPLSGEVVRGAAHGLRNEMSKLSTLKKFLWLDLFFVMLKLYLRDLPFQARLLLAKRVVNVGFH